MIAAGCSSSRRLVHYCKSDHIDSNIQKLECTDSRALPKAGRHGGSFDWKTSAGSVNPVNEPHCNAFLLRPQRGRLPFVRSIDLSDKYSSARS